MCVHWVGRAPASWGVALKLCVRRLCLASFKWEDFMEKEVQLAQLHLTPN